jgi:hypothetical protein
MMTQGAPKKKNKSDVPLRFLRSGCRKYFYGVFGLLMQRKGQKRDKQIDGKKFFFNGVFELPLLRNAQKRHIKKKYMIKVPTYPI